MELLTALVMGLFVASTGVVGTQSDQSSSTAQVPKTEAITPVVQESKPEPEPEPAKEPEPEPAKEPEPEPEPEPTKEPEPQQEEPKEEVNAQPAQEQDAKPEEEVNAQPVQEQDAKPEEEEAQPVVEETEEATEEKGISALNIILYILGAIAVIAAGIYFFMRREPTPQSAADIGRAQSQEPIPEPQEEPAQEEAPSEPEQPVQEDTPSDLPRSNLNQKTMINHQITMMRIKIN